MQLASKCCWLSAADENHFLLCKPLIGILVQSGVLLLPEPGLSHAEMPLCEPLINNLVHFGALLLPGPEFLIPGERSTPCNWPLNVANWC